MVWQMWKVCGNKVLWFPFIPYNPLSCLENYFTDRKVQFHYKNWKIKETTKKEIAIENYYYIKYRCYPNFINRKAIHPICILWPELHFDPSQIQSSSWIEVNVPELVELDSTGMLLLSSKKLFTTLLLFTISVVKHCLSELNDANSL